MGTYSASGASSKHWHKIQLRLGCWRWQPCGQLCHGPFCQRLIPGAHFWTHAFCQSSKTPADPLIQSRPCTAVCKTWEARLGFMERRLPHDHVMSESRLWYSHPSPWMKMGTVFPGLSTLPFVKVSGGINLGSFTFSLFFQNSALLEIANISSKTSPLKSNSSKYLVFFLMINLD